MWPNLQFPLDLFILIEEILNGKLNFLCNLNKMHIFTLFLLHIQVSRPAEIKRNIFRSWKEVLFGRTIRGSRWWWPHWNWSLPSRWIQFTTNYVILSFSGCKLKSLNNAKTTSLFNLYTVSRILPTV